MISENTKAVLLLTTFFNSKETKQYKPLTENGYGYLACWLSQNGFKPEELLSPARFDSLFEQWDNPLSHTKPKKIVGFAKLDHTIADITYERLHALLSRGASLSIALDKWTSAGIWIMDRQSPFYPKAIKGHLKHKCPALFFGVGNIELLNKPAIGFVGSRDCTQEDILATKTYVETVNKNGLQVVSGAAKGIDSEAMLASINNGNTAIGIIADSLYRASGSGLWRQALRNNQLVLITPFYPDAGFTPKNAMSRNKFIYMLSNSTMVVCSGEKGGTWEGAKENLKNGWAPLLVSTHAKQLSTGSKALIAGVGIPKAVINATPVSFNSLENIVNTKQQNRAFDTDNPSDQKDSPELNKDDNTSLSLEEKCAPQGDLFSIVDDTTPPEIDFHRTVDGPEKETDLSHPEMNTSEKPELSESILTNAYDSLGEMPLLAYFYQQLVTLIEASDNATINEEVISTSFPEFELLSKSALVKWLKHLLDLGLIIQPNNRKKEYGLPMRTEISN